MSPDVRPPSIKNKTLLCMSFSSVLCVSVPPYMSVSLLSVRNNYTNITAVNVSLQKRWIWPSVQTVSVEMLNEAVKYCDQWKHWDEYAEYLLWAHTEAVYFYFKCILSISLIEPVVPLPSVLLWIAAIFLNNQCCVPLLSIKNSYVVKFSQVADSKGDDMIKHIFLALDVHSRASSFCTL